MDDWFVLDNNSVPAVYVLQSIPSRLPHYNDMSEENSHVTAKACIKKPSI